MKKILHILLILIPTCIYGKNNQTNEPWEIGCDTVEASQLEMNLCSYESYMIADSILTNLHTELTQYCEIEIKKEKKYIESPTDSIQIKYVNLLQRQPTEFKKSINNFYKYRYSTVEVINLLYDGGSMRPLAANTYALRLTVNQIATIRIMIEEIKH